MPNNNFRLIIAVLSVFSFCLLVADANAADMRMHPSICTTDRDNNETSVFRGGPFFANNSDDPIVVYCPVPSSSSLRHSSVSQINVHGYEGVGRSNFAFACSRSFNNSGITCGPSKNWGSGYAGVYGVDPGAWTVSSHFSSFPYISIVLDVDGYISGYWISD